MFVRTLGAEGEPGDVLDQVFAFGDLQRLCNSTEIDTTVIAAALSTDGTRAQLVRHGGVGFETELDTAALAASLKGPAHRQ
jgi:hypothetical protein